MGSTPTFLACLLLGSLGVTLVCADLMELTGVQGPAREKRRSPTGQANFHDCPPSSPQQPAPQQICPPGTHPRHSPVQLPHGVPSPCAPWIDDNGWCHVGDRQFSPRSCRETFGQAPWYRRRGSSLGRLISPPGPGPDCVPN